MNRVEFQQTGGFPLETDTLNFLQSGLAMLQVLFALGGDNYIVSGCVSTGSNTTDGFVVLNGELLPFKGGLNQTRIVVRQNVTPRNFENGTSKGVFIDRFVTFGTGDGSILFTDLQSIKNLKTFRELPHLSSDLIDSERSDVLATSKAVKNSVDALKNQLPVGSILIWSGAINTIPAGFALCDGLEGRPNLKNTFVLGAGDQYSVGAVGGEKEHVLTIAEMPAHHHTLNGAHIGQEYSADNGSRRNSKDASNPNTTDTGGNMAHNNMPPYYALAYIIKL